MNSIYDFSLENQNGEEIPLSHYQGRVLIVVNTATGCGLTPNTQGLQDLYLRYQEKGLEILDIPSNQFMGQAPGTAEEINSFCSLNFWTTFPRFAKAKSMVKKPFLSMTGSKVKQLDHWANASNGTSQNCHRPTTPSCPTLLLQNRASCHGRLDPRLEK